MARNISASAPRSSAQVAFIVTSTATHTPEATTVRTSTISAESALEAISELVLTGSVNIRYPSCPSSPREKPRTMYTTETVNIAPMSSTSATAGRTSSRKRPSAVCGAMRAP